MSYKYPEVGDRYVDDGGWEVEVLDVDHIRRVAKIYVQTPEVTPEQWFSLAPGYFEQISIEQSHMDEIGFEHLRHEKVRRV